MPLKQAARTYLIAGLDHSVPNQHKDASEKCLGFLESVAHTKEYPDEEEMSCESAARKVVEQTAATIEKDEVRGVIYMEDGEDHRFNPLRSEFKSGEDVMHTLIRLGEDQWILYAPFNGGKPVFQPDVSRFVQTALIDYGVESFFDSILPPDAADEIVAAHDLLVHHAGLIIKIDLQEINEELVRYLALHPEKMHELNPRKFEHLVAELFRDKGYDVELGRGTKDGGVDIRAFLRSDIGALLTLIQCKRNGTHNRVKVDVVRGLYGVVTRENASSGVIVTTSTFTRDARSEQQQVQHRIQLAEYEHLTNWLAEYPRPGRRFASR